MKNRFVLLSFLRLKKFLMLKNINIEKKGEKQMKEKLKNEKGITLIALVITIIVLLILAGVTIATLTGENGILTKTTEANLQTQIGEEKEAINLAMQALLIDKVDNPDNYQEGIINNTQLKNEMDKSMPKPKEITINEITKELTVKFDDSRNNRTYTVGQAGEIGEIVKREGIKVGDYVDYQYDDAEDYIIPDNVDWVVGSSQSKVVEQNQNVRWRILNIYDDGRVDLISESGINSGLGGKRSKRI